MSNQPNTPQRPARSFGSVQETFRYRLGNFNSGDQFTIVEDMPRSKPVRLETNRLAGEKNGRKYDFVAETFLIKVVSRGYEADIELKPKELMTLATLCPKGLDNFKGATFVFDGYNWAYMGIEIPQTPISNISQAMRSDPRQPDLNAPVDQRDLFLVKLTTGITTLEALGNKVDAAVVMKICDNIMPGKGIDLFSYAKTKGSISEVDGAWKVTVVR